MGWLSFLAATAFAASSVAAHGQAVAATPIPPATIDDTLDIVGDGLDATRVRSRLFVAVGIDGRGPFRFLVDSGADRSVVGAAVAARLALPPGAPVTLQGMAGTSRVATVAVASLTLGASTITDLVVPALPERYLGAQGLLGIDALAEQRLMLDFAAKQVTVQDSARPEPRVRDGEIVVTARRRRGQLILTQASVGGGRVDAVIDTGAELTMGNSALAARVFRGRAPPPQPVTIVSVTGQTIVANLAVLPRVTIGGIVLQNVPVAFVDAPPFRLFGLDRQPAMLLGTDLLESFARVSLDFRARKVRFTLRRPGLGRVAGGSIAPAGHWTGW